MKRFTETEKWRDAWFRKLPARFKVAFQYLVDTCDCSGVWEPDYELASFSIGEEIDWNDMLAAMGERVIVLPNGKWFLAHFVAFQYGALSDACKPHQKVIATLKSHSIPTTVSEGYHIPFPKGMERVQEEEEDKETEEDKDRIGGAGGKGQAVATPKPAAPVAVAKPMPAELPLEMPLPPELNTPAFRAAWADWLEYRRERRFPAYKPKSLAGQINALAGWGHDAAILSIRDSIRQQWQGLFAPKIPTAVGTGMTSPGANRYQHKAPTAEDHARDGFR